MKVYRPHRGQRGFHRSTARFRALFGGRGSGKTTAGVLEVLRKVQERPGWPGLILAPSVPMFTRSTWPEFARWLPWSQVTDWNKSEKRIVIGDTTIYYGSLDDPDSFRGPNVNWLWLDEGGKLKTVRGWNIAIACLRVGPEPQGWVTTTPAGRAHWLYETFVLQQIGDEVQRLLAEIGFTGQLFSHHRATIHQNRRNLDPLYYASLLAAYTGKFAEQELEGKFVSFEGLVYDDFGPENISALQAEYNPELPVEWAIDDGYTNPRAILLLQRWPDGHVTQFAELYHTQHLAETCIDEALGLGYSKPELAIYDPAAVELRARLRERDIVARPSKCKDVVEGIKRLRRLVCDGNGIRSYLVHPRCTNTIREFGSYVYPEAPEGQQRAESEKPVKANDHTLDGLRYWVWNRVRAL